jgi:hypothetical protein
MPDLEPTTAPTDGGPSGLAAIAEQPDIIAEMRRILADIPRPVLFCHPDDQERIAAALHRLPWPLPVPELMTNPIVKSGQAIFIADARVYLDKPTGDAVEGEEDDDA